MAEPVLKERSRVYRMLAIVILALIINGVSISVIGTLCLGASEPICNLLQDLLNFFIYFSFPPGHDILPLCTPGLVSSSSTSRKLDP